MATIRREVLDQAHRHAQGFRDAQPFRHIVVDDFFEPLQCQSLLDDFPRFEDRHALNEMGEVGGKAVRMDVRDIAPSYRELDRYLQTREFLDFVSTVTGIPDLLYDPDYIGGGTHENREGQGLDQHVDFNFHPRTRWHRRLNLIVYLNREWEESWGGMLELQADPWNGDTRGPRVAPIFNRAVIFETTERSWHGFSTIHLPDDRKDLSRKSFAIYLYTKERPAAEVAAAHATVYVPEALPATLRPGVTLEPAHITDLNARFARMLAQLKFLYAREKEFAIQIAALEGALAEARSALRLPLQGYATQSRAPQGLWPDGWVAQNFSCIFESQRKMRGIELELWVPQQLDGDQTLEIEVEGRRWTHHVARGSRSRVNLDVALPAGHAAALRIDAGKCFVPASQGQSGDDRGLAWKLIAISLDQHR